MDPTSIRNNKGKWKYFLASIDTRTYKYLRSNNVTITTKRNIGGLAREFADKLLQQKGGTVVFTGYEDVLNRYKHLDVGKNQPERPITTGNIPLSGAEDELIESIYEPAGHGAYRVRFDDGEGADDIIEEQSHTDETLMYIEIPVVDIGQVLDDVDIVRSRDRKKPTPSNKKNDIDKSCSSWSISNIAEYFLFDECVTKIEMPIRVFPHLDNIHEKVHADIFCRLKSVKMLNLEEATLGSYSHHSEFLKQLISITSTEAGSRLVLDALLVPLCSELGLQFEVDKNINCNCLPNCRFDYCIRKGDHIIGCIEAKSVKSLSDRSIAQAVLQLMILQTLPPPETPKVDISGFPVFAIVTDGHRFIYMQLKGSSLGFEHNGDKLRIREVKDVGDFKDILQHIMCLVEGV